MRDLTNNGFKFLVILVFASILFALLYQRADISLDSYASASACPESMPNEERLECLKQEMSKIEGQKQSVEGSIDSENFEQLSLYEQINYLSSLVEETELKISEIEIDIETKNLEVKLLGEDIISLQNNIDTLLQEINLLETTMDERTVTSYKISLMSPVEIMLESQDLETMMRRMKYLLEMKKKDRELLAEMNLSKIELEDEEEILAQKRADVQDKRNEIESERALLAEERTNLESQKGQQQVLLAQSQQREAIYAQNLDALSQQANLVTQQITKLIIEMYNQGQLPAKTQVKQGDIIGFQGHTGYSYGSHLHFELYINGSAADPIPTYLSGSSIYQPVSSNLIHTPLASAILTQDYHAYHSAIDLVSSGHGIQPQDWYLSTQVCCYGLPCIPAGQYYPLRGEGAPVYAVADGMITSVQTDACGGKYTLIDHGTVNGQQMVTMYLHLR